MKEKTPVKSRASKSLLFGLTASLIFAGCSSANKRVDTNDDQQKKIESSIDDNKSNNANDTKKHHNEIVKGDVDNGFTVSVNKKLGSSGKRSKNASKKANRNLSIRDYHGYSIVDALEFIGYDSSFQSRAKLAKKYGIKNYRGKAKQNTKLLKKLKSDNFSNKKNSHSKSKKNKKTKNNKLISVLVPTPIEITPLVPEPTATPTPTRRPTPTGTPAVVETAKPIKTPAPVITAKPTGTPAVVETAAPVPIVTPPVVETAKPIKTPAPVITAKPTKSPAVVETVKPTGTPVVVETVTPVPTVTSSPVVETATPVPTVTPTPIVETATPVPTVTPTPVVETATPVPTVTPTPVPTITPTSEPCQHGIYDEINTTAGDDEYCYHLSYACNLCGETISLDTDANKHNYVEYHDQYDWYKECSKCYHTVDLPQDSVASIMLNSLMGKETSSYKLSSKNWSISTSTEDTKDYYEKPVKSLSKRK